jgi:hypothetical protein
MGPMEPKVKTISTKYLIKVNGLAYHTSDSLRAARTLIKTLPLNDDTLKVEIVKRTETETVLDTYSVKTTKVLSVTDLDLTEGETDGL